MESGLASDRSQRQSSVFEKQAVMAKSSGVILDGVKIPDRVDISRPPGLPDEMVAPINKVWVPPKKDLASAETLLLSLPQRAYAVGVAGCCALAFGHGTAQALEAGIVSPEVVDAAAPIGVFLLAANVASAALSGSLAKRKGRSVPLWAFKGALAGLLGVLELRRLTDSGRVPETPSAEEGQGST